MHLIQSSSRTHSVPLRDKLRAVASPILSGSTNTTGNSRHPQMVITRGQPGMFFVASIWKYAHRLRRTSMGVGKGKVRALYRSTLQVLPRRGDAR